MIEIGPNVKRDLKKDLEIVETLCMYQKDKNMDYMEFIKHVCEFAAESRDGWPYWIERATEAEELLKEIIPAAKFQSCYFNNDKDTDPLFHCCDWSEWVRKVNEFLGGSN
jgi:hypothetical protein